MLRILEVKSFQYFFSLLATAGVSPSDKKNICDTKSFVAAFITDNAIGGAGSGPSVSKAAPMLASSSACLFPAMPE